MNHQTHQSISLTAPLPKEFVDAHHHFVHVEQNDFQSFLGTIASNAKYLAQHYNLDVVEPLARAGVHLVGSVHVECMPDDGYDEIAWIESMKFDSTVKAIVASCNLANPTVQEELAKLKQASPNVRGIRWILDCVGPFEPDSATHIATTRHDGIDYLRGSSGGHDGTVVPEFERGFLCLADHGLSFDLQCAPAQLLEAAALCARHPNINVCIDHMGKPRMLLGTDEPSNTNTSPDARELERWRQGMKAMADLPNVYVKISMLGYAVPGWIRNSHRIAFVRQLVLETVNLFGPKRCMVALNWWKSAANADADGLSDVGPDPVQFLRYMASFFEGYSEEDREQLFVGTARRFYRF
jgi:predicted TIM-barrel fold metal-dependent hydrolase